MGSEWIFVAVIGVILLLSAKKLPDMARGLGQSMRIFKAETRGMREDDQRGRDDQRRDDQRAVGGAAPGRAADDPAPTTTAPASSSEPQSESRPGGPSAA